jgi:hypothetical protein
VLMLVEDMSRNKFFFSVFEYHMFQVLYPFVTYLLALSHTLPPVSEIHLVFSLYDNISLQGLFEYSRANNQFWEGGGDWTRLNAQWIWWIH